VVCDGWSGGGGREGKICTSPLRRMVYLSRYAVGGWRHTRERRQGSVGFGLEALKDLRVKGLRTSPQLNSVCPHGLEDTFVAKGIV